MPYTGKKAETDVVGSASSDNTLVEAGQTKQYLLVNPEI